MFDLVSKVILDCFGFAIPRSLIGPENSRYSLNQSDAKLKQVTIWSLAFSRALNSSVGFTLSSHWLSKIFSSLLIGRYYYFDFGFKTLSESARND